MGPVTPRAAMSMTTIPKKSGRRFFRRRTELEDFQFQWFVKPTLTVLGLDCSLDAVIVTSLPKSTVETAKL
jgi:hypothetical protein